MSSMIDIFSRYEVFKWEIKKNQTRRYGVMQVRLSNIFKKVIRLHSRQVLRTRICLCEWLSCTTVVLTTKFVISLQALWGPLGSRTALGKVGTGSRLVAY